MSIELSASVDLRQSLSPLGRWGDDGVDRWDGTTLARTVRVAGVMQPVAYAARIAGHEARPTMTLTLPATASALAEGVRQAVKATLVALPPELAHVAAADGRVGRLFRAYPGIIQVLYPDPFSALVRSISAQQVNLRWAATIRRRLAESYGYRHEVGDTYVYSLDPRPLADATVDELRALQLTTNKSRSVIAVARAAVDGELDGAALAAMDDDAVIAHLTRLHGIGVWSAEWFLARTLGRPRVVAGDLGVRKAVGRLYDTGTLPSEPQVRQLTAHWRGAASAIQALALHDLAVSDGVV